MTAVTEDLIDGASFSESSNGLAATRTFLVTGLSGSPSFKTAEALFATGIPRFGDAHPNAPGVVVVSRTARPASRDSNASAIVQITYGQPTAEQGVPDAGGSSVQFSLGSSVQSVTTQKDASGNQILLSHTFTDTDESGNVTERIETQGGEVDIQVPQTVFRVTRRESQSPGANSLFYTGKINSVPFLGGEPKTWLCTRIEGDSDDGGETFVVAYEFQYNRETWDATVVFIDPDTGRPPKDLVDGEGIKTVRVYQLVDFNALNLGVV